MYICARSSSSFFFFPATTACCFLFLFGVYSGVHQGSSFVLQKTVKNRMKVYGWRREREGAAEFSVAGGKAGLDA